MFKSLQHSDLCEIFGLMSRQMQIEESNKPQRSMFGFGEGMDSCSEPSEFVKAYQNLINRMSVAAQHELHALLMLGSPGVIYEDWQQVLEDARYNEGGDQPHKQWLWGHCVSFRDLSSGVAHLLCCDTFKQSSE